MPFGYTGKILRLDLTAGTILVETPSELFYRTYMGGSSLAHYYLLRELPPGTDPLGPDNLLIFVPGIFTGIPMAGMSRYTVAARSPLTGAIGEAEAAGFWGPELKRAGFDAVLITGRAARPAYIWIHDGAVEIREAAHLWGLDTGEAQERIQNELGDANIRVALIGPGGENRVRFACVVNNLKHANGRTGLGAVMGSKNLKAVAVRGTGEPEAADSAGLKEIIRSLVQTIQDHPGEKNLQKIGTPYLLAPLNSMGILPTRNFLRSQFSGAEKIQGETLAQTLSVGNEGCYACPVRCKRKVAGGRYEVSPAYGGPEYETIAALGSCLEIDDLEAIAKGSELCNRYTLDSISTGAVIAFAMECFENGVLTAKDTDGLDLRFGNAAAMLQMIERIARREGLGDLLAEGVRRAAEKIGGGAEKYALSIKGQEIPMHDPRGKFGMGLGYAVSPTGADHMEATHDTAFQQPGGPLAAIAPLGILEPVSALDAGPRKVRLFRATQQIWNLWDCLGICNFIAAPPLALSLENMAKALQCLTGWKTSLVELLNLSDRAMCMARVFNFREGFRRSDDSWPERFFEPLPDGPNKGHRVSKEDLERAKDLYYDMMGWDRKEGRPTEGRLAELGLDWLISA